MAAKGTEKARDIRGDIVEALMRLAAERDWDAIRLSDIAAEAGVTLAEFRGAFGSKGAVLAEFSRRIDKAVLEAMPAPEAPDSMADQPARERVFDVMMRRLDALTPYRAALKRLSRSLRRELTALPELARLALNSQRFMLEAAGIDTEGAMGRLRLQGAVLVYARVLDTWYDDDDPALAATMARLDRELTRGERMLRCAEDAYRLAAPFRAAARVFCEGRARNRRYWRERARSRRDIDGDDNESFAPAI
ncbi:transcriptional regulator, TetR family [Chelatococcus sambhunathii]|uniref:TetR family transcriptional regulator n=2 Tax=Chelatococcus TaxID=28209 RepID=A0AAC9NZK3_9HYPH|nr:MULTISPECIES: TetR family transcriptional regulator [Chelatococcus]APF38243.1 TetR family transcriptional regulator [Chelatococcus daeguensis]CUA84540.1 transcriptional regulator, TetR family [Chelatococcus sambhunathii]